VCGRRGEFGNVGLVKEVTRDMWKGMWLEDLWQDLRYGLRYGTPESWIRRSGDFDADAGNRREHGNLQSEMVNASCFAPCLMRSPTDW